MPILLEVSIVPREAIIALLVTSLALNNTPAAVVTRGR